ncbi:L-fucose/L-arabinose isomerase family protein [Vallicoccus soli]|uniref:FucIase n=1 Tax=Vallicoccus soli TaxID=2339232 RepID=A0A3A3YXI4_9ACTN|nr:L-fucose/L-arabinose isomerase family protein [Vallicoccus soli]RJK96389.1 fucose isomerase [Vallicoccus soli]
MARIGILSMSDGRDYVQRDIADFIRTNEDRLAAALQAAGHDVVRAEGPLDSNTGAVRMAREVAAQGVDLTVFHYCVWAFPHFTMLAAGETRSPLLLLSNIDPVQPGMVGMLAGGGALDQVGRVHDRLWGEPDEALVAQIASRARAASAVSRLRGSTFGRIGGRPMGMNTAVSATDQWQKLFGIDVEEIDQWEVVRRSELVDAAEAAAGREWLEKNAAGVHYDGDRLTPELLERQLRSYLAVQDLVREWNLDFSGIKGQPELTGHFATMDVAEALLNDPYDWNGPKETHVCATESDMDAALTMQVMKHVTGGLPVLFADVRHYHTDLDVWDLCNSGQHATWYAARSDDPTENLSKVHLYPEVFFFPAGGASVHHLAAPGEMTLARFTRKEGRYRLHLMKGAFETYDDETNERLMRMSTYEWPHAFARLDAEGGDFLSRFGANHIHAVPGDVTAELRAVARMLDVELDEFTRG